MGARTSQCEFRLLGLDRGPRAAQDALRGRQQVWPVVHGAPHSRPRGCLQERLPHGPGGRLPIREGLRRDGRRQGLGHRGELVDGVLLVRDTRSSGWRGRRGRSELGAERLAAHRQAGALRWRGVAGRVEQAGLADGGVPPAGAFAELPRLRPAPPAFRPDEWAPRASERTCCSPASAYRSARLRADAVHRRTPRARDSGLSFFLRGGAD
mmetsp:Transcript_51524/g.149776  ORF Transcript_51524/g.149776 Transcript_51524/m.149776 type:complete len:210 (+) Transcript_51524:380-1009(+)